MNRTPAAILIAGLLVAFSISLTHLMPEAQAASGESAKLSGNSTPLGYQLDNQTGPFLTSVAAVASSGGSSTATTSYSSGGSVRTFYPAGRQNLSLFITAVDDAASCTVRLEYWSRPNGPSGAREWIGHADYTCTVAANAQAPSASYSSPRQNVDGGGAAEIDVKIISITSGPIAGVHLGSF